MKKVILYTGFFDDWDDISGDSEDGTKKIEVISDTLDNTEMTELAKEFGDLATEVFEVSNPEGLWDDLEFMVTVNKEQFYHFKSMLNERYRLSSY